MVWIITWLFLQLNNLTAILEASVCDHMLLLVRFCIWRQLISPPLFLVTPSRNLFGKDVHHLHGPTTNQFPNRQPRDWWSSVPNPHSPAPKPLSPLPHKSLYKLSNTVAFFRNSQFPTFPNLSLDFVHLQHFIVLLLLVRRISDLSLVLISPGSVENEL